MKTRLSAVLLTFVLFMSFLPMNVLASNDANGVNNVLSLYLQAIQESDVNQIVSLSDDSRVPSDSVVDFYTEILKSQPQLVDYKILNEEVLSPTSYKFIAELTYKNGDVSQVPITLNNMNGKWKVIVTPKSLEDSDYKMIKSESQALENGSTIPPVTNSQELAPLALTPICSWSFTGLYTTLYSIQTFNVNSVYSQVLVQGGQGPSNINSPYIPTIRYAVVQQKLFGDDVWGATDYYGKGAYSFLINGKSKTYENAKMRFTLVGGGQYDKADGNGNAYNN